VVGVTGDDLYIFHFNVQQVGNDLSKYCEMRLSLCAVAGCHGHLPASAHGYLASFIRTNRCTLCKCHHANAQPFAFLARFGLGLFDEFFVIHGFQACLVISQVITAVENILNEILSDDTGLERELIHPE
jgi:hypothetical protein